MRQFLKIFSIASIIFGLIVSIFFLYQLSFHYKATGNNVLLPETGQAGDFIGGVVGTIFSLAGFFILVLTLNEQTNFAAKERFESKFFELLKLHRENVKELEKEGISGRKEFQRIFMQFLECRNDMKTVFRKLTVDKVYEKTYKIELSQKLSQTNENIDLLNLAKLNLPYLVTFYGVGSDGKQAIYDLLDGKYKKDFLTNAIEYISMKPVKESNYFEKWEKIMKLQNKHKMLVGRLIRKLRNSEVLKDGFFTEKAKDLYYKSNYVKYYGGHQYELGHYFRHLFQSFKFINIQEKMKDEDKYFYAKTFRAQLSTYEQFLLFINSLSTLGLVWDLTPEISKKVNLFTDIDISENRLITKYNLIKNMPGKKIFGISFKEYYPDVEYENNK